MLARGTPWAHRALWAAWGTGPRRGPHPMRAPSPPRAHRVLWVWKPTPHGSQKTLVGGPTPHGSLPHRTGPTGPCGRTRPHQAPERGGGSGLHGSHGPHRALSRDLTHAGPIWILRRPRMSHTGPVQVPHRPHTAPTPAGPTTAPHRPHGPTSAQPGAAAPLRPPAALPPPDPRGSAGGGARRGWGAMRGKGGKNTSEETENGVPLAGPGRGSALLPPSLHFPSFFVSVSLTLAVSPLFPHVQPHSIVPTPIGCWQPHRTVAILFQL